MDSAGRLVIPRAIRERSGFGPDTPLEIGFRDGRIEISAVPRRVRVVRKSRVAVAVALAEEQAEALTTETVRQTQRRLRKREG